MRNKVAKKLKKEVALKMFTKEDVQNKKKAVYASKNFKRVYRARKKNYLKES